MATSLPYQHFKRPLVLIVDRYEDSRVAYALALSAMGFDVIAAKDSDEGRTRAKNLRPDVIVTELGEPEEQGVAVIDPLGFDPSMEDIPVVVVADRLRSPELEPIAGSRFAGFFTKPCPPERLAVALWHVVDRERARKILDR